MLDDEAAEGVGGDAIDWIAPSRRVRIITATPRIGQCYWIDFPHDAYAPEFVGEHPGIVVRAARRLNDTCIVVPLTSSPQMADKHIHQLSANPNPRAPGVTVWAVCDHLYTVHLARLRPFSTKFSKVYPKASVADTTAIFAAIKAAMPQIP